MYRLRRRPFAANIAVGRDEYDALVRAPRPHAVEASFAYIGADDSSGPGNSARTIPLPDRTRKRPPPARRDRVSGSIAYRDAHFSENIAVCRGEFEDIVRPHSADVSPACIWAHASRQARNPPPRVAQKATSIHTPRSGFGAYLLRHRPFSANIAVGCDECDDLVHPFGGGHRPPILRSNGREVGKSHARNPPDQYR